jgi:D-threo-aldose 1-dehydrogenase
MTHATWPKVIFGTSALGNLYSEPSIETKQQIVAEIIRSSQGIPVFDSAGKYGAGLALECLAQTLGALNVDPSQVKISNKLGWQRVPLRAAEPQFEPGAWVNLKHDAVQSISYEGILACFEQGNQLLGPYKSRLVSVHDPDEYLAAASSERDRVKRTQDLLEAYRALAELKAKGEVDAIGVGSKDPYMIDSIAQQVPLDWAMFACSITPYTHTAYVVDLITQLANQGVKIINSAVFNAGFLVGGSHFDYRLVTRHAYPDLFAWRDKFFAVCDKYQADPAAVCVQFSFRFPQITSVALNTSSPGRVASNLHLAEAPIAEALWVELKQQRLITV